MSSLLRATVIALSLVAAFVIAIVSSRDTDASFATVPIRGSICVVDGAVCAPQEFTTVAVVVDGSAVITRTGLYGIFRMDRVPVGIGRVVATSESGAPIDCFPRQIEISPNSRVFPMMCFDMKHKLYLPMVSR